MGDKSGIEWTGSTWNPMTGCVKVSQGCKNCYAERVQHRWGRSFDYQFHQKRLDQPARWQKARTIFVCSMSDLFQEQATDEEIDSVVQIMVDNSRHTYQVLTKRTERMSKFWWDRFRNEPPRHIWMGTSVENQETADKRMPTLTSVPAWVRFVSVEPLLGPVSLIPWMGFLHWIIVGGESGPAARDMAPNWARDIRDQCVGAGVPFFFKQWGGVTPKAGGRELDGKVWSEMPS